MAQTLYEYYTGKGETLPSLSERAKIYEAQGLGSASGYAGSAEQNSALLNKLQSPTAAAPAAPLTPPQANNTAPSMVNPNYSMQTVGGAPSASPAPSSPQPSLQPLPQPLPAAAPTFNLAPQAQTPQAQPTLNLPGFQQSPSQQVQWTPPPPSGSSLLDFANALDAATGIAKQNRNASSLGLMMPFQGTVAASDFNSILGNLNAASDNTAANLTNRALTAATPKYETQQIGNQMYQMQYDSNGRFVGATPIATLPEQYSYGTMNQGDNTYQIQYDSQGKAIGQQLLASTPSQKNQNTFQQQQIGDTLYEFEYSPQGQLVNQRAVGNIPSGSAGSDGYETRQIPGVGLIAYDKNNPSNYQVIVPEPKESGEKQDLRSVSGVGLVAVKPDGSYTVVVPEKDKPASNKPSDTEQRRAEISSVKQQVVASKGSDGYVNTEAYRQAFEAWDGTISEFFDYFPTSMLNPEDPTADDLFAAAP